MKVFIIEDERMAQNRLERLLKENFQDIEIVGSAPSVASAYAFLTCAPAPDVIFMDVELQDGNCFEIFRRVEVKSPVIMTTAYDSYAIKAFESGSVDYLLKPVDVDALRRAMRRCVSRAASLDVEKLLAALKPSKTYKEKSVVRSGDRIIPVSAERIAYFFSEDKANYLMTKSGEKYIIDSTLDTLESELNPAEFFRISRNCIVAIGAIKSASSHGSGRLLLSVEPKAPFEMTVSRSRVEDFLSWLE